MREDHRVITLRIIFYGLMAFVPSNNSDGLLVLFADPSRVAAAQPGSEEPRHEALAFQVHEKDGTLVLEKLERWPDERVYVEVLPAYADPLELSQGLQPIAPNPPQAVPYTTAQTRDFAWSPLLTSLAPESQSIRAECLVNPTECPVSSVFRFWQGEVKACHLAHAALAEARASAEPALESRPALRSRDSVRPLTNVIAYTFRPEGARPSPYDPRQAIADAVMVETIVRRDEAVLRISNLEKENFSTINLVGPDARDVITLLFANVAVKPGARRSRHHKGGSLNSSPHFRAFYQLAHTSPDLIFQAIPHATEDEAPLPFPMDCEKEIVELAEYLKKQNQTRMACNLDPFYIPHSIEVCGTTKFPATLLPSWRSEYPSGDPAPADANTTSGAPAPPSRPRLIRSVDRLAERPQSDQP